MITYRSSGVNVHAGNELVRRIKQKCPSIGGFSGLVPHGDFFIAAGVDGVGTKLKLAMDMNKHDTIGIDLVAMSVNDVICCGAKPMFFLDYLATGKLDVDKSEKIIDGIIIGCERSDCILLGGETAEMPSFYPNGEYDLAGFAVGIVKKDKVIDGSRVRPGDKVIGLPSSGIHSNGFSLVRKILEVNNLSVHDNNIGNILLEPTTIYVDVISKLIDAVDVRSISHITGEGLPGNIPRSIPDDLMVNLLPGSWSIPYVFTWLQMIGNVPEEEMFNTFNMGIGMVIIVPEKDIRKVLSIAPSAVVMGTVHPYKEGDRVVFG